MFQANRFTWPAVVLALVLTGASRAADETKADAEKDFATKKVNLTGQMALSEALAEVKKQTGIEVEDRTEAGDPRVKLNIKDATFWQALEAIAREADVRVHPAPRVTTVALVEGPYKALPIHFHGPFRAVVKRVNAFRDLETDAHFYTVQIEIAWEPGIRPFFQDAQPPLLEVSDDKGRLLKIDDEGQGQGRMPVNPRTADVTIRLAEVPRSTPRLGTIKGVINLLGPTKWLTFQVDNLGDTVKEVEKTQDGVSARFKLSPKKDLWDVEVSLNYPPAGLNLESFEIGDFVVYNEMTINKKDGKPVPPNGGFETRGGSGSKAMVVYTYDLEDRGLFGKEARPGEWSMSYRTPGPMKEIPVKFEFKDLVLP